jgi:hypothetical protein
MHEVGPSRAATQGTPVNASADAPDLHDTDVWTKLGRAALSTMASAGERYELVDILGIGSTGQVFAVLDRNLDQQVAVKALSLEAMRDERNLAAFLDEARITAALKHPNVLPVLDINVTRNGRPYFSMRKIDGRTLGDCINASSAASRDPRIARFNTIVSIFIGICNAVAYAHHQRIIHQDIKPDNILIGDFGEVLVLDWGCACRIDAGPPAIYGTPLYMSPEQARRESVNLLSDVYCIGATLLHALTLRVPTWTDDADAFWRRKCAGEIDAPTAAERTAVPGELLSIAIKALSPLPTDRYASVEDLRADLERYQAGLAVHAHADSLSAALWRWHRRHARSLWTTVSVALVIASLVAMLYGERLKELARWGTPLPISGFGDDQWVHDWTVRAGGFHRQGDRLVSDAALDSLLLCNEPFAGAIAVDYDGEVQPKAMPGDLSLVYFQGDVPADGPNPLQDAPGAFQLQVGAFDGRYCQIVTDAGTLAFSYLTLEPGRVYHIRDEIEGDRITVFVDGRVVCDYRHPVPFAGGHIALRAYYSGKAFSHLRISKRAIPEKLPATALGDLFVQTREYERAAAAYQRVVEDHRGSDLGRESLYREGLCAFWQRRYSGPSGAFAIWQPLVGTVYDERIQVHRLDQWFDAGEHDHILNEIARLYPNASADLRRSMVMQWCRYLTALTNDPRLDSYHWKQVDSGLLTRYIDLHDRLFGDEPMADRSTATALLDLRRFDELLRRFPRLRYECGAALFRSARWEEILRTQPDGGFGPVALLSSGRSAEISPESYLYELGLIKRGHPEEVVAHPQPNSWARNTALLAMGRIDEAMSDPKDEWAHARALSFLGRTSEVQLQDHTLAICLLMWQGLAEKALPLCGPADGEREWARSYLGLQAWIRGDRSAADAFFVPLPDTLPCSDYGWRYRQLLLPFLHGLGGNWTEFDARCRDVIAHSQYRDEQHPWYDAAYVIGQTDEKGYLSQPHGLYSECDLRRCQGIRAEREGRREDALTAYRAYLAMPLYRRNENVDPVWNTFVEWRVSRLQEVQPR